MGRGKKGEKERERETGRDRCEEEGWRKKVIKILGFNNATLPSNPKSLIKLLNSQKLGMNGLYCVYE